MFDFLKHLNYVDLLLALIFIIPVAAGAINFFSKERISYSLSTWLDNLELAVGIVLSVYLTKRVFFVHDKSFFNKVYDILPEWLKNSLYGKDVLTYIAAAPVILLILLVILRILTIPLRSNVVLPLSEKLYTAIRSMRPGMQRLAGALWQIPRALIITLLVALILNFSTYYIYAPGLSEWMNSSTLYQVIYDSVLSPVLNSNIAKQIPVIVNDSFRQTAEKAIPKEAEKAAKKLEKLTGGKIRIIEYFNGVTLDEAVKSNEEIDDMAKKIVGAEKDEKKKAYLIYKWISRNIKYDIEKAERISKSSEGTESGSIVTFNTRKGICFDYSSLYVTMCSEVGLKVRLITGLGYSGVAWGDHAWNQVYCSAEKRWINLDATFGASGINYFDKRNFEVDHSDEEVQGEW